MAEGDDMQSDQKKLENAIKDVLKTALVHDGLARGLKEAVKALDRRQAMLCLLAKNCTEAAYTRLVEALCTEHNIMLMKVDDNTKLGEWVGLCKIDKEGKPRKVVKCSCVVIKDIGQETEAWSIVLEYMKSRGGAA